MSNEDRAERRKTLQAAIEALEEEAGESIEVLQERLDTLQAIKQLEAEVGTWDPADVKTTWKHCKRSIGLKATLATSQSRISMSVCSRCRRSSNWRRRSAADRSRSSMSVSRSFRQSRTPRIIGPVRDRKSTGIRAVPVGVRLAHGS
jgi:hypothetical protein